MPPRVLSLFLAAAVLCGLLPSPLAAAAPRKTWTSAPGETFTGTLEEVYGSIAVVKGRDRTVFLPIAKMSDDELRAVGEFLDTKPAPSSPWRSSRSLLAKTVLGAVDELRDGSLTRFSPGDRAEPEIYLIYFSARWCGPCHRFTPELVAAYRRYQQVAPGRVEVVFMSDDEGPGAQTAYVREMGMPWLVVRYNLAQSLRPLRRWAGSGIPCLVALTRNGTLLLHSYQGETYVGPDHVLDGCNQLVAQLIDDRPVARRALHRLRVLQRRASKAVGDAPPEPYVVELDSERFQGIALPDTTVTLQIDVDGKVAAAELGGGISYDLERLVLEDARSWLFLPAMRSGAPAATTFKLTLRTDGRIATMP